VNDSGGVDTPLSCMKHPIAWTLAVPELVRAMVQTSVAPTHDVTWVDTMAVLVNPEGGGVVVTVVVTIKVWRVVDVLVMVIVVVLLGREPDA